MEPLTETQLLALDRRALQALCKANNLKANGKTQTLVEELLRVGATALMDESKEEDAHEDENDVEASDECASPAMTMADLGSSTYASPAASPFSPATRSTRSARNSSVRNSMVSRSPSVSREATPTASLSMQAEPMHLNTMASPLANISTPSPKRLIDGGSSPITRSVAAELERRIQEGLKNGAYANILASTPSAVRTAATPLKTSGYFDAVHQRQFDRMQSIADHPSVRRTPSKPSAASSPARTPGRSINLARALELTPTSLTTFKAATPAKKSALAAVAAVAERPATRASPKTKTPAATTSVSRPGLSAPRPVTNTANRSVTKPVLGARAPVTAARGKVASAPAFKPFVARPAPKFAPVPVPGAARPSATVSRPAVTKPAPVAKPAPVVTKPAPAPVVAKPAPVVKAPLMSRSSSLSSVQDDGEVPPLPSFLLARGLDENMFTIDAIPPTSKGPTSMDAPVRVAASPRRAPPPPRPKFDIKQSMARPLSYKPHTGALRKEAPVATGVVRSQIRSDALRKSQQSDRSSALDAARGVKA